MSVRGRTAGILAGLVAGAFLVAPSGALASSAFISGPSVFYLAAAGEANELSAEQVGADYVFTDPGAPITPMAGCTAITANSVKCASAGLTVMRLSLGDLNDTATVVASVTGLGDDSGDGVIAEGDAGNDTITGGPNAQNTLYGYNDFISGPGGDTLTGGNLNDSLIGGTGSDVLNGGGGSDRIFGEEGNDFENGGPGNDTIDEGIAPNGADVLSGGTGRDNISYSGRTGDVKVTQNGAADDGEAGEGDNVSTQFTNVQTGSGNDTIVGIASNGSYSGLDGNDTISAGGGDDQIDGGAGNDTLKGEDGSDVLDGSDGNDSLDGGAGDDALEDGGEPDTSGSDRFAGGPGTDLLEYASDEALSIDLDGVADDGRPGENDNAGADLEDLTGSPQADVLIGNDRANQIEGGAGADRIEGRGGDDGLEGGSGGDRIDGGSGTDEIDGADGADVLRSRDSAVDDVNCGSDSDTLLADGLDDFTVTCDQVSTGVLLKSSSARLKRGRANLRIHCPAAEGAVCPVKVTGRRGRKVLVRGSGRVKAGKTGKVKVKLTKAGKRARGRLKLTVRVLLTDAFGGKVATSVPRVVFRR